MCITQGEARPEDRPAGVASPIKGDSPPVYGVQGDDELTDLSSAVMEPPVPSSVQCYWQVPKAVLYLLEFAIFIVMGLAGT